MVLALGAAVRSLYTLMAMTTQRKRPYLQQGLCVQPGQRTPPLQCARCLQYEKASDFEAANVRVVHAKVQVGNCETKEDNLAYKRCALQPHVTNLWGAEARS